MVCPKCNKEFSQKPAFYRIDNTPICPMCGYAEALEYSVKGGIMTEKEAGEILGIIRGNEKNFCH